MGYCKTCKSLARWFACFKIQSTHSLKYQHPLCEECLCIRKHLRYFPSFAYTIYHFPKPINSFMQNHYNCSHVFFPSFHLLFSYTYSLEEKKFHFLLLRWSWWMAHKMRSTKCRLNVRLIKSSEQRNGLLWIS